MAKKMTTILRKVFLSSLAGIVASNANFANSESNPTGSTGDEYSEQFFFKKNVDLSPKLILKQSDNDEWNFMAHRSHRSHQSHRSHYSSSTGGSTTTKPKTNQGIQPSEKNNTTDQTLKLGSRTLKNGMSGTDVTELVNILLKKEYLKLDDGSTIVTGALTYDEIIEDAVKKYQKDNGLTSDGVCGPTTVYYLKNK